MARGKIQGEVWGEQLEHEIEECDVVVAFGIKDLEDKMDVQVRALGYGLTNRVFISAIASCVVQLVLDQADSSEEKRTVLALLMKEIANNALAEIGNRTLFRREASGEVGER